MVKHKNHVNILKIVTILTVFICVFESFTKGWLSVFLVPISFGVIPLYILAMYYCFNVAKVHPYGRWIKILGYALSVFLLAFYVCVVGVGDTNEVLLFGFLSDTAGSPLTLLSILVAVVSLFAVPATLFAIFVVTMRAFRTKGRKNGPKGPRISKDNVIDVD